MEETEFVNEYVQAALGVGIDCLAEGADDEYRRYGRHTLRMVRHYLAQIDDPGLLFEHTPLGLLEDLALQYGVARELVVALMFSDFSDRAIDLKAQMERTMFAQLSRSPLKYAVAPKVV